jgi:cation transport ATPase
MDLATLHLVSLIITVPVILFADHMGFQYFTGRVQTLNATKVMWAHRLVTIGLLLLIATGIALTVPVWAILFENPYFYAKLAFVTTLALNGYFIEKLMKKATITPFAQLTADEKRVLLISGAVSGASWVATVFIAFFRL